MIRPATADDLPGILAIYNDAVLTTTAIWNVTPSDMEGRRAWLAERTGAGFPVFVAAEGERVLAYGTYGPFRPHEGYRNVVEHSIYVAPSAQGRGLGKAMLRWLIEDAQARGFWAMIGGIDADNDVSLLLHERFGFREVGRLPAVGEKFGRKLDLVFMQKDLLVASEIDSTA